MGKQKHLDHFVPKSEAESCKVSHRKRVKGFKERTRVRKWIKDTDKINRLKRELSESVISKKLTDFAKK